MITVGDFSVVTATVGMIFQGIPYHGAHLLEKFRVQNKASGGLLKSSIS
jgi:hypothetical protein